MSQRDPRAAAETAATVQPALSTSVLLLRDGPAGLETFVVVRDARSASFPGLLVFPGGMVDPEDRDARVQASCTRLGAAEAARRLRADLSGEAALALYVAGVRELFEEAGVLLARRGDQWVTPDVLGRSFADLRGDLYAKRTDFTSLCEQLGLDLAVETMGPFAHWITPTGMPRRFDTRFFVAELPAGQEAKHDQLETSSGSWLTPQEALARYRHGHAQLAPPTFMLLSDLCEFDRVADALAATHGRELPVMLPRMFPDAGGPAFLYPGDAGYADGDPGAPGPRHRMLTESGLWRIVREA